MKTIRNRSYICLFLVMFASAGVAKADQREAMKQSLVYLEISAYGYDQLRPWRNTDIQQKQGVGCAISPYEVITTAWNVTDAKLIKAKVFGQNEYIPARIKVVDYEIDLALVELEPNALTKPLKPIKFKDKFRQGTKLDFYWLNNTGHLTTGQGSLDRAEVYRTPVSYTRFLNFVVTNTSQETSIGQVYSDGSTPVGIACWSEGSDKAGLIPAVIINDFLARAKQGDYRGVATEGFSTGELLDPAMRRYLKMPAGMKAGALVTDVYNIGTGSDQLRRNDVILAIDGKELDAYGRIADKTYDRIDFSHLITRHRVGDNIAFDIWRDGGRQQLKVEAKNFDVAEMLVPYYEFGRQPEYVVTGGFVFQKLTRSYLANWGKDWAGKVSPHMFQYFQDKSFKPTDERRDIVILSYVLPAQINLGYSGLAQLVVSRFNGMPISSIADIAEAQKLNPDSKYDVVEFELDNPTVVIPRGELPQADFLIAKSYGIRKGANIEQ